MECYIGLYGIVVGVIDELVIYYLVLLIKFLFMKWIYRMSCKWLRNCGYLKIL